MAIVAMVFSTACVMHSPEPGETTLLVLEGDWSAADAQQVRDACADWHVWSEGRLSCEVADRGDATLLRQHLQAGDYYRIDLSSRTITIDLDQARAAGWNSDERRTLIEHALGRAVGIEKHDGIGVMSRDRMTPGFTEEDRVVCRAAGYCS